MNLRKGDRFWYENGNHPGSFTKAQLQEIRKSSLTRVICDGLDDIESLQPFAFLTVDGFNNQRYLIWIETKKILHVCFLKF